MNAIRDASCCAEAGERIGVDVGLLRAPAGDRGDAAPTRAANRTAGRAGRGDLQSGPNQDGGYTGMRLPITATSCSRSRTRSVSRTSNLVLGGDHPELPNPWTFLPAAEAMNRAGIMVIQYVRAGLRMIHLD